MLNFDKNKCALYNIDTLRIFVVGLRSRRMNAGAH